MAAHFRAPVLVGVLLVLLVPAAARADSPVADGSWLRADARWERSVVTRYVEGADEAEIEGPTRRPVSIGEVATPPERPRLWVVETVRREAPRSAQGAGGFTEMILPEGRDLGLFLAAQSALWIDMAQTLEIRRTTGLAETNALLGERPSDGAVLAYFGSISVAHTVAYLTLGPRWANLVSRSILFVQVPAIDNNARLGIRISF